MGILFPSSLEASFETSTEVLEPLQAERFRAVLPEASQLCLPAESIGLDRQRSWHRRIFISQLRLQKQFAFELFVKGFGRVVALRRHLLTIML